MANNLNSMHYESKRQELASRLVDREVYYCVSSLVSTLSALAQNCDLYVLRNECLDWEEDILPLLEWIDYDEALRQYVMDDADLDDMENMVDECGYWEDFLLESVGYDVNKPPQTEPDEAGNTENIDLEDWLEQEAIRSHLAEAVADFLIENGDTKELCQQLDVNTDDFRGEIYEHWLVSDWLAHRLAEKGEVTGDLCGLTIWGRGTTGQSISIDRVVQNIALEIYDTEWQEFLASSETLKDSE